MTGGAGTDTLNYDAESRAVSGDTTPPDGIIDSPGVQSVIFTQIETVNILNAGDTGPTITPIANHTISANTSTAALAFTVGDLETPAGNLIVSGSSSNTARGPDAKIAFGGSGANLYGDGDAGGGWHRNRNDYGVGERRGQLDADRLYGDGHRADHRAAAKRPPCLRLVGQPGNLPLPPLHARAGGDRIRVGGRHRTGPGAGQCADW